MTFSQRQHLVHLIHLLNQGVHLQGVKQGVCLEEWVSMMLELAKDIQKEEIEK